MEIIDCFADVLWVLVFLFCSTFLNVFWGPEGPTEAHRGPQGPPEAPRAPQATTEPGELNQIFRFVAEIYDFTRFSFLIVSDCSGLP